MITFSIDRSTAPSFTPVTITLLVDTPADMTLITNLFGGVPAEVASAGVNDLSAALRASCDVAGITKSSRKLATGFNWGKKLRELSDVE